MKDWLDEEMEREGFHTTRAEWLRQREEHAAACDSAEYDWLGRQRSGCSAQDLKDEHARAHNAQHQGERPPQQKKQSASQQKKQSVQTTYTKAPADPAGQNGKGTNGFPSVFFSIFIALLIGLLTQCG